MMTFEEWIATQDESKFDLDPASVESIKDWFRYREICDDDKMETFFWRQLRLYRYKYKQLLRMETTEIDRAVVSQHLESCIIERIHAEVAMGNQFVVEHKAKIDEYFL